MNSPFPVRQNLYGFFQAARRSDESYTTKWMWIDQVCINQKSLRERGHHVEQMATVCPKVMAIIVQTGIMPKAEEPPDIGEPDCLHSKGRAQHGIGINVDESLLAQLSGNSLSALLKHLYWFRLWIVQVIALASCMSVFLTTATYPWEALLDSIRLIERS